MSGFSQVSFAPYEAYTTGSWPEVVCIGDINNDGLNDVVLGTKYYNYSENDNAILVYLQDINGTLSPPVRYSKNPYTYAMSSMTIADVNNDKLNDVIIGFNNSVGVFYQNSMGTLNPMQVYTIPYSSIGGLSVGDLNNDGLNDIAVSIGGVDFITTLLQKTTGGFSIQSYPAPSGGSNQIEVADINSDLKEDVLLILGSGSGGLHVFTQNNSGTLNNPISYPTPNTWRGLGGFKTGYLNNDNLTDLVWLEYGNSPNSKLDLMFQDPITHLLKTPIQLSAYDCPEAVRIDNLNCDARNEIIVLHGGWNALTVYEQDNNGNYNTYSKFFIPYATHYNHQGISVGDINNDGLKDIAIADYNNGLVILMNQSKKNSSIPKPQKPTGENKVCDNNQQVTYNAHVGSDDHVVWNLSPLQSGTIISSSKDSCKVMWNSAWRGQAGVSINVSNACGRNTSDTLYIISNRLPSLNLGNDTTLCKNNSLTLRAGSGFATYKWQDNSSESVYHVNKGGNYYLEASNNCGTRSDTIKITDIPLPTINLKDTFMCSGTTVQVNATLPGSYFYHWQDNASNPIYNISNPGSYALTITDAYRCVNSKSFEVKEVIIPNFQLPNDTTICKQDKLILDVYNKDCRYTWQDGNSSSQYLVEKGGVYSVTVSNECASITKSTTISITNCNSYLDVPSAFSPNDDGLNDILYAVGTNVENIHFIIYNRWGQKVFESANLDSGWDGTFQGKKLEASVFIYYVTGKSTSDGHLLQKHGNVSLIR